MSASPTATIDLTTLAHNLAVLRRALSPSTLLLAAVKANAYGHGAVRVTEALTRLGVSWFGVATREEALELRHAAINADVLVFTPVHEGLIELLEADVALTVTDAQSLALLEQATKATGLRARAHLKVDTGMGRLGLPDKGARALARALDRAVGVTLEGLWTHFACADEAERSFTLAQLEAFQEVLVGLEHDTIAVSLTHAANSAGLLAYPSAHLDMVRPGIALYGYHSSDVIAPLAKLRPVMTLTAPIIFAKRVPAGRCVSYGTMWRAPRDTTVATVRLGYADGYPRALSNRAEVLVQGNRCKVAGRVCMDQLMVDVGDLDVSIGENVTLFGPNGLTAEEVARRCGTISYELLTQVGARVTRQYVS